MAEGPPEHDEDDAIARHMASVRLPRKVLKGERNVWFSTLIQPGDSWCEGGTNLVDAFEHQGHTWFVDENYCPRPACDCRTVRLAFVDASDRTGSEAASFDLEGPVEGPWSVIGVYGALTRAEAQRVLQTYQVARPDLGARVQDHYLFTKVVGARGPRRRSTLKASRIARNGPCPCGSGRRHKACCGRRRPA